MLNPWVLPSLCLLLIFTSYPSIFPFSETYLLMMLGVIFTFSALLPIISIFTLYTSRIIKNYRLEIGTDRMIAMLITTVYYAILTFLVIDKIGAMLLISAIVIAFALATAFVTMLAPFYSACPSSTSAGAVLGTLFAVNLLFEEYNLLLPIAVGILMTGSLISIRLYLNQQTLNETVVGFSIGFFTCLFTVFYFG
ncbi:hypothetical protein R9C00_15900 [Flammeovirgaceae bacterium SG7u.111]|nr:hypothetical protein [Flammeovirgaceae bacterium SG7u.132]WPO33186.1 hypothetical protein R9C00_15900 [Flammeovirgaceae bacterium SG7u.111]